jgi:macrodomain Ter protein organizer (MatP/YcbG family)
MPFKSRAQRRKFAELLVKGEISPETFEEWNRETGSAKLPERVKKSAKGRKKKAKSTTHSKPRRKANTGSKKKVTRRSK